MTEALIALVGMSALFWAVPLIGRFHDMGHHAIHASRAAAFFLAQDGNADLVALQDRFFSNNDKRWRDDTGAPLLHTEAIKTEVHGLTLPSAAQPGSALPAARALRNDWHLNDQGVVLAQVSVQAHNVVGSPTWENSTIAIHRHTAILAGAGHATSDIDTQHRIAEGRTGWRNAADFSRTVGEAAAQRMYAVDAAWRRPRPEFDWLSEWAGLVPANRLIRK